MTETAISYQYSEDELNNPLKEAKNRLLTSKLSLYLLTGLLFVLPLYFGGIGVTVNYTAYICTFAVLSLSLFSSESIRIDFSFKIFSILVCYLVFQYFFLTYTYSEHPVLGKIPQLPDSGLFFDTLLSVFFFFSVFYICRNYLDNLGGSAQLISDLLVYSAFAVSLVGLSHWFYDNGKLFWFFEPKSLHISERARWPFVNPNHLGNYLLLAVFVQVSRVSDMCRDLVYKFQIFDNRKGNVFLNFISSSKTQGKLIKLAFSAIMLLSILICISATLSRGTWTGFSVGFLSYIILSYVVGKEAPKGRKTTLQLIIDARRIISGKIKRKKKKKSVVSDLRVYLLKISKPLSIIAAAYIFLFFLNEQGQELIAGRIEYGLKYSLEDTRWTMYADTLEMIKEKPLFGIGLGQWQDVYPAYMDPSLSGLYPVYLHSEPLQMVSELGIAGSLILLAALFWFVKSAYKFIVSNAVSESRFMTGLICGVVAFSVATLVEFPLRMPAIQVMLAVNLAVVASLYSDFRKKEII